MVAETSSLSALHSATRAEREQAWSAFYSAHFPALYRLVCRFGVAPGDVEDVTQQVFLVAYRKLAEGLEVEHPRAWLRGIAVRVVADRHRWRKVRRVKQWLLESTTEATTAPPKRPDSAAEDARTQERVSAVLRTMTLKLRTVLVLCDIDECSPSEAAEILEVPVNTVRSRRRIARATFQKLWDKSTSRGEP